MPRLTLVIGHDPRRLLAEAAEGFLIPLQATNENPFPTPSYLLALRQGGVRDDLIALAAERQVPGWFDPPLCIFHELPRWLGSTPRNPCGDFERAALLGSVVRKIRGEVFSNVRRVDDFLSALERFFGELRAEGISPSRYAAALNRLDHRDEFETQRDRELAEAYRSYCEELDRAGLRDGRDTYVDCAQAVREDPEGLARRLDGRREIRFFGLHDLRGGWPVLLEALVESPSVDRVLVYTAQSLDFGPALQPETVILEESPTTATRLFSAVESGDERFEVIEAPNVERELGEVARRVRELGESGVPLHRIAIVARQARPYLDFALRALNKFGIPATARRRLSYQEIPVVRAVLALFAAAADGWSRRSLVELADQPYFQVHLDAGVLDFVGYRGVIRGLDAWKSMLDTLEQEAVEYARDREKHWRERPPPRSERVAAAREAFAAFAERAEELDRKRPLQEWFDWLVDMVESDPWHIEERIYDVPQERFDLAKRDLTGWRGLRQILEEWRTALGRWSEAPEPISVAAFYGRLQEMLAGDAALWTETLRGVQVVEGLAAAYRSFDHTFLVGLDAGRFPVSAPRSPLLDQAERTSLREAGLSVDNRADWETRERTLFRNLVAGAREGLTVSYSRLGVTGRETIRSAFVEALADVATEVRLLVDDTEVLTPGMPLCPSAAVAEHAARVARIERVRDTGVLSPYNGQIEHPELVAWLERTFGDDRHWSATQLEAYAKCPWAYFSSRLLRLEKYEDPDEEMEATVRGSVFHDALARFFEEAGKRKSDPVFLREPDLAWAEPMLLAALDQTLEAFARTTWLGHPALRGAKRAELRRALTRYLRWEVQHHEDMYNNRKKYAPLILRTGVSEHEREFEGIVLERGGVRFKFRGSVDRVEIGVDERLEAPEEFVAAVDYKTSEAGAPGGGDPAAWDDSVVLQVPLYAHALTQLLPGTAVSRVEYRALLQRKPVHSLELHQVDKKSHIRYPNDDAAAKMGSALDAVASHVRRVRSGEFPADPAPSCRCPPFCHAWDICRVAGGPQTKREHR